MKTDFSPDIKFYSFFTRYSLMDNYGFLSGLYNRLLRKIIPDVPADNTIEFYLMGLKSTDSIVPYYDQIELLLNNPQTKKSIENDLDKAISALATKIISFGFDHKFQSIFEKLNIDSSCYKILLDEINHLSDNTLEQKNEIINNLDRICESIEFLRKNKNVIGTSLHLTVTTRQLLKYINRTKKLIELKFDIYSEIKWKQLIYGYIDFNNSKNSLRKFYSEHADLLTLEVVEHTAQKGEKYMADNYKEYVSFFYKGLLGGAFISFFALNKIVFSQYISEPLPQAFIYSINYALCFVIVYLLGGTIATKQPAMTASTIAKNIDKDDDLQFDAYRDIILLLRKIIRSQFISLVGNFLMALILSAFIAYILRLGFVPNPISTEKSAYLLHQVFPFEGGALFYAAIAGFFLSFSGFISGFFDNKVKFINLSYRIQNNLFLKKYLSLKTIKKITNFVDNKIGIHAGNISLGIFLGTAFLLSNFLPFNVDIRHIAFSSSNLGYSLLNNTYTNSTIFLAIVSVFIIGIVNFFVSFSITFLLVLKSRGIKINSLGRLISLSLTDFSKNPLDYLIIRRKK